MSELRKSKAMIQMIEHLRIVCQTLTDERALDPKIEPQPEICPDKDSISQPEHPRQRLNDLRQTLRSDSRDLRLHCTT